MPCNADGAAVLTVSDLTVQRGDTIILDRVSWQVKRGEHWTILGGNGSGKTSLLSALTGYLTPSRGEVEVLAERFGRSDWRELRKKVGLVSSSIRQLMNDSEPALQTDVSGRHAMIDFWGRMTAADEHRARKILRNIDCSHLADRPWRFLSQGERQRVLIGRALMADPALLILDEPCAGLDPAAREHFLQFLQSLACGKNPPTLVLVTHHVEEIIPCFSHVLILREGRILASGKRTSALTSRHLSEAFKAPIKLIRQGHRYRMEIQELGKSEGWKRVGRPTRGAP